MNREQCYANALLYVVYSTFDKGTNKKSLNKNKRTQGFQYSLTLTNQTLEFLVFFLI